MITVKKLIEALQNLPDDAIVSSPAMIITQNPKNELFNIDILKYPGGVEDIIMGDLCDVEPKHVGRIVTASFK